MSQLEQTLEEFKVEMEQVIFDGRWYAVQDLYKEMEEAGLGQYVPEVSSLMTEDDVREYKKWDKEVNGDITTQSL